MNIIKGYALTHTHLDSKTVHNYIYNYMATGFSKGHNSVLLGGDIRQGGLDNAMVMNTI